MDAGIDLIFGTAKEKFVFSNQKRFSAQTSNSRFGRNFEKINVNFSRQQFWTKFGNFFRKTSFFQKMFQIYLHILLPFYNFFFATEVLNSFFMKLQ